MNNSDGDTVAGDVRWRKPARCAGGDCVEVARIEGEITMRNSTDPNGPMLRFTIVEWLEFIEGVWSGEFADLA